MAMSNINMNPYRPKGPDAPQENRGARKSEKPEKAEGANQAQQAGQSDNVSLGASPARVRLNAILMERTFTHVEMEVSPAAQELFNASGKTEFQEKMQALMEAGPEKMDTSPEATAGRILEGITGYIFKAFQSQNPEMTEEDFTRFQEQVLKGFETGLGEAKDILSGLNAMNEDLESQIGKTEELVRDQLATFFEEQLEIIRENKADSQEAPEEVEN